MFLNPKQQNFISRIDCSRCHIKRYCDQIKSECPKANFQTLTVDDASILKPEAGTNAQKCDVTPPSFIEITRREFERHLYGNISRCRDRSKILSFFSGEKEVQGFSLYVFSHQGRYYRALRDTSLTDAALEQQVINFLYPDNKSFMYAGWTCWFNRENLLFYLYSSGEMQQPPGMRNSEFEASSPAQAIEFINCN
jgi:hypothetical protein